MCKAVIPAVAILLTLYMTVVSGNYLPKTLLECFDHKVENSLEGVVLAQDLQKHCLDMFLHPTIKKNMTTDEVNYLQSIFRKIISESNHGGRVKRRTQLLEVFPKRIRREVRDPMSNWPKYSAAVRRLKFDMSSGTGTSRYDTIADLHRIAVDEAHGGPNFLPWHRLYLLIFETACGMAIPFWDSSIDFEMADPTESKIWTEDYFGNGFGEVESGPFSGFDTPIGPLIRNIGSDGSLFQKTGILRLLSKRRFAEINVDTSPDGDSLEDQHGQVHIWCDGQMNNLERSPFDPIFWSHHCFVDYIWELFRTRQKSLGINPATDFSPTNKTGHSPNDEARGITGYLNVDGYSNRIAKLVEYKLTPSCPKCSNSDAMHCDRAKQMCIADDRTVNSYVGHQEDAVKIANKYGLSNGNHGSAFTLTYRDARVRVDSVTLVYRIVRNTPKRLYYGLPQQTKKSYYRVPYTYKGSFKKRLSVTKWY
ncbi:tyrosinase-like protein 1 [Mytilus galloprovincialis]|uniref:tyrosinase-like protein 1 n=1 Tax=Mytilus galloprovincialis TaxID=29158 RepID=UPI003F7C472F